MSYSIPRFLTVSLLLSLFAATAFAQRDIVQRELDELAAPAAWKRAAAVSRLAELKEDIAPDLRVAWKIVENDERTGLLKVAQLRGSDALLQQAAAALSDKDESLSGGARDYLLALPLKQLQPELDKLDGDQREAWQDFYSLRIRRDIAALLLQAQSMPGKYFGQFDVLREIDGTRLDTELMAIATCSEDVIEALDLAANEAIDNAAPERVLDPEWRNLRTAANAFAPAVAYLRGLKTSDDLKQAIERVSRPAFYAALNIMCGVRTTAVRALARSTRQEQLRPVLNAWYKVLLNQLPDAEYVNVIDLEDTRQEIELTLARFGDPRLLQARIAALRNRIERAEDVRSNVNMSASARPDLVVQNQIAHLLLRSGDFAGAEKEWAEGVETALVMLRISDGRNRSSLSSYLAAVYYNLACTQSLQLKHSKSLHSLKEAVRYGYKDFAWMLEDGDLHSVRQFEGFGAWFEDVAPPSIADRLHSDS